MARTRRRCAFTLVELLVVIAIIALLVGILVPSLGHIRRQARDAATRAQLDAIGKACEGYKLDHEFYPGYFRDSDLGASNISSTENLLACISGRVTNITPPPGGEVDITGIAGGYYYEVNKVGSGQISIAGQTYGAYYIPKAEESPSILIDNADNSIPDISDASYGMPILYFRSRPGGGPVASYGGASVFDRRPANPYLPAGKLKNPVTGREFDQTDSILRDPGATGNDAFAAAVINEKLSSGAVNNGVPRGGFVLWATGADGTYLSDIQNATAATPADIKKFDDIIHTGGTAP